ncbi:keratin, type I cytoskeletal 10-like isoform X1 [Penaeus monodon]|uniref:keratin, type I cytoskeletal 10-like isoform X1 n=1 Tax=Penaeus monodon TaxID=6687 RepID=UPI0018A6D8F4|nr:keratin, type I cytoskeletal 10-like isoform X1 [Penaeus monodon]
MRRVPVCSLLALALLVGCSSATYGNGGASGGGGFAGGGCSGGDCGGSGGYDGGSVGGGGCAGGGCGGSSGGYSGGSAGGIGGGFGGGDSSSGIGGAFGGGGAGGDSVEEDPLVDIPVDHLVELEEDSVEEDPLVDIPVDHLVELEVDLEEVEAPPVESAVGMEGGPAVPLAGTFHLQGGNPPESLLVHLKRSTGHVVKSLTSVSLFDMFRVIHQREQCSNICLIK